MTPKILKSDVITVDGVEYPMITLEFDASYVFNESEGESEMEIGTITCESAFSDEIDDSIFFYCEDDFLMNANHTAEEIVEYMRKCLG